MATHVDGNKRLEKAILDLVRTKPSIFATAVTAAIAATAVPDGQVQYADVTITHAELLALRATPKTLLAAPGAGKIHQILAIAAFFDYTAVYGVDDATAIGVYYDGTYDNDIMGLQTDGFLNVAGDIMQETSGGGSMIVKAACDNKAIVLKNTGVGELTGGDAANVVRVRIAYRVLAAGW